MKTVVSNAAGARTRLAWIACAALTLAACTGPGLEPPNDRSGGTGNFGPGHKTNDAGAAQQQHPGSGDMSATGSGGSKGSSSSGGTGGSSSPANSGGSGGGSGGNPPVSTQDAGVLPVDAGDEDGG